MEWVLSKEEIRTKIEKILVNLAYKKQGFCKIFCSTTLYHYVTIKFKYKGITQYELYLEFNNDYFIPIKAYKDTLNLLDSIHPFDKDSGEYYWSWDNRKQDGDIMENPIRIYNYLSKINGYDFKMLPERINTYLATVKTNERYAMVFFGNTMELGNCILKVFDDKGIDLFSVGPLDEDDIVWYMNFLHKHIKPFDNYDRYKWKIIKN